MKKIKIFKKNNFFSLKNKILFIIFLISIITCYFLITINKKVIPIIDTYSQNESKRLISLIINDSILKMSLKESDIEKYLIMTKNKKDEIISIDFNSSYLNQKLYELTDIINNELYDLKMGKTENLIYFENEDLFYYIPFGVVTSMPFLSGLGPKLPIKINVIGNILSNAKIDLVDYGINNALIKVFIEVEVNISVIIPFNTRQIKVENQIPIIVKMIQGSVPSIYGGLYSNSSPSVIN